MADAPRRPATPALDAVLRFAAMDAAQLRRQTRETPELATELNAAADQAARLVLAARAEMDALGDCGQDDGDCTCLCHARQ